MLKIEGTGRWRCAPWPEKESRPAGGRTLTGGEWRIQ
jgi:hypothetical protein